MQSFPECERVRRSKARKPIHRLRSVAEIPRFRSAAEEAEFWATHSLVDLWDQLESGEMELSPTARRAPLRPGRKGPVTP